MALKPCLDCGALSDQARCPRCRGQRNQERDQRRGSSTARGYDHQHEQTRERWRPYVEAGQATCWRCGEVIRSDEPWDVGHDDHDRSITRGPEHARRCNRSAGGRAAHPGGGVAT